MNRAHNPGFRAATIQQLRHPPSREIALRAQAPPPPSRLQSVFYLGTFLVLCAAHSLLPVERGLPTISFVKGAPLTITIIISIALFLALVIESKGAIFKSIDPTYIRWQLLFVAGLSISVFFSPDAKGAAFVLLNYCVTFIINFSTLSYILRRGSRAGAARTVCVIALIVAGIGFIEYEFRYYIPLYAACFKRFGYGDMTYAMAQTGDKLRLLGTLGNSILHGALLALALPYALGEKGLMKWLCCSALIAGIILSTSATGVTMAAIVCIWPMYRLALRSPVAAILLLIVAIAGGEYFFAADGVISQLSDSNRALRVDSGNVLGRLNYAEIALDDILTNDSVAEIVVGRGIKTTRNITAPADDTYGASIENSWLTLAFEAGLPTAALFIGSQIAVLANLRRYAPKSAHWWAILAMCAAGASFTTVYYASVNFLYVASIAWLTTEREKPSALYFAVQNARSPAPVELCVG